MRRFQMVLTLLVLLLAGAAVQAQPTTPPPRAGADGKYASLLRVLPVPDDQAAYGEFNDWGHWTGNSYAGHDNLPPGYWVYLHPNWYIWRELAAAQREPRRWGPEQATGAPDTLEAGDLATAWASASPDGQEEWLELEYAEEIVPAAVIVHETFNPGALRRVTLSRADTEEVEVWSGKDPVAAGAAKGVAVIPVRADFPTRKLRLTLDSAAVPGWNEIDAVGLVDQNGVTHWAARATASSTYASDAVAEAPGEGIEERLARLEAELRELRQTLEGRRRIRR